MPKIYPFDSKSAEVEALFGYAYAFDPNTPTKYTEALSYLMGTIIRELDLGPVAEGSKIAFSWPDQEDTGTNMADDIADRLVAAGLPAIITPMLPAVIVPLLVLGTSFLVGASTAFFFIGRTIIDRVIQFVLNICLEHYKKEFIEGGGDAPDFSGIVGAIDDLTSTVAATGAAGPCIELDGVRWWPKADIIEDA